MTELLHHCGSRLVDEKSVVDAVGIDLKIQTGILRPPLNILPDADPKAFLVGQGMVQPGIPVDSADL